MAFAVDGIKNYIATVFSSPGVEQHCCCYSPTPIGVKFFQLFQFVPPHFSYHCKLYICCILYPTFLPLSSLGQHTQES